MAETIPPPTDADRELALQPLYLLSVNGTGVDVPIRGALIRLLAEERRLREQAEADVERLSLKVNDLRQQLDARRKSEADAVAENERMRADLAEAVETLEAANLLLHFSDHKGCSWHRQVEAALALVAKHNGKQDVGATTGRPIMTTLTRESIAALSGRKLDAAVHELVFGLTFEYWCCDCGTVRSDQIAEHIRQHCGPLKGPNPTSWPEYSHPDCRGLAEMIAKARERGLSIQIRDGAYRKGRSWAVTLTDKSGWAHIAPGSTLPEAFGRALLLATLEATT